MENTQDALPIIIYTDGGCSGNPGPGGWGAVIIDGDEENTISGGEAATTNNRMELMAAISALEKTIGGEEHKRQGRRVEVYCDSQYVKNGITTWIKSWKSNGWRTAAKKPVRNKDLWERLDALVEGMDIKWSWVKGHAGVKYNEVCDRLCQQEIQSVSSEAYRTMARE